MTWIWVLLGILVLGVTAAVAVGYGGSMSRTYPDRPDVRLPAGRAVTAKDLGKVAFSVVHRGYRMDEVDDVMRRLAVELAERDALLDRYEQAAAGSAEQARAEPPAHVEPFPPAEGADRVESSGQASAAP